MNTSVLERNLKTPYHKGTLKTKLLNTYTKSCRYLIFHLFWMVFFVDPSLYFKNLSLSVNWLLITMAFLHLLVKKMKREKRIYRYFQKYTPPLMNFGKKEFWTNKNVFSCPQLLFETVSRAAFVFTFFHRQN